MARRALHKPSRGVGSMARTLDCGSEDPGSIPGRPFFLRNKRKRLCVRPFSFRLGFKSVNAEKKGKRQRRPEHRASWRETQRSAQVGAEKSRAPACVLHAEQPRRRTRRSGGEAGVRPETPKHTHRGAPLSRRDAAPPSPPAPARECVSANACFCLSERAHFVARVRGKGGQPFRFTLVQAYTQANADTEQRR